MCLFYFIIISQCSTAIQVSRANFFVLSRCSLSYFHAKRTIGLLQFPLKLGYSAVKCILCIICHIFCHLAATFADFLLFKSFSPCSEVAFGYKGLQIQLFYTAGNLSTLFKVKYSSKVTDTFDCVEVRPEYLY